MSIHAKISREASEALEIQKRNSTISSIIAALLFCALLTIILAVFFLESVNKKTPEIISYAVGVTESEELEDPKIKNEVRRLPSAPSSSMSKVIASAISSQVSIPVPEFDSPELILDFGSSDDFGDANGFGGDGGSGDGSAGSSTGFGYTSKTTGTIRGELYDFKQNRDASPNKRYTPSELGGQSKDFFAVIRKLQRVRLQGSALKGYYRAPKPLYARYIAIPKANASAAPEHFDVANEVKPSSWLVLYKGKVKAPKSGRFRFVGVADDAMMITLDRKWRLNAQFYPDEVKIARANSRDAPTFYSPYHSDIRLDYGSWFDVREGQILDINIAISENPGGHMYFILMLEEKGATYRKASNGRNILPPFTMGELSKEDKDFFRSFPSWQWETEEVPVFEALGD